MKECWINVYKRKGGEIVYGYYWLSLDKAKQTKHAVSSKLLYRIHVRLK